MDLPEDSSALTRFALLLPESSGGNFYDRAMIGAIKALGHDVDVWTPGAPGKASDDVKLIVDRLALHGLQTQADTLAQSGAVLLIHHPATLEQGYEDAERDRLRSYETATYRKFGKFIATSSSTAERLAAECGVEADKITVVVPGTADAPRSTGSGGPTCAILSVGTPVPREGHSMLLDALARLTDLDWRLTIAGSSEWNPGHAGDLEALVQELGLASRVTFAGALDDRALDALWREADIYALATRFEGYGAEIAEALKRGVPPAVTAGGAAGSLVTPESGTVSGADDLPTYSKSLRRMIFDTNLRRDMAEAAWKIGQTLPTWPEQAASFIHAVCG